MQTFNYLIHSFMTNRQAWLAQAIVSHLRALRNNTTGEAVSLSRLLPVWEMIAENLQRHALQPDVGKPAMPIPVESELFIESQRISREAQA
jgi:hypothetical protein